MGYKLTEGQIALEICAFLNQTKECDAQGHGEHALPQYLTVH